MLAKELSYSIGKSRRILECADLLAPYEEEIARYCSGEGQFHSINWNIIFNNPHNFEARQSTNNSLAFSFADLAIDLGIEYVFTETAIEARENTRLLLVSYLRKYSKPEDVERSKEVFQFSANLFMRSVFDLMKLEINTNFFTVLGEKSPNPGGEVLANSSIKLFTALQRLSTNKDTLFDSSNLTSPQWYTIEVIQDIGQKYGI
jgi:hypothetical protein